VDKYVAQDSEFDAYWADEQNKASKRMQERWDEIQRPIKCSEIREAIRKLKQIINDTTYDCDRHP
jgi:hypothetical protein